MAKDKNRDIQTADQHSLASAMDVLTSTVSGLDSRYKELKDLIQKLNLQISRRKRELEENFFKVNQLRWFFDSILNSMTDGVIVIDTGGKIVLFNKSAVVLTGYNAREVIGKKYRSLFGAHVSERFTPIHTLKHSEALYLEEKQLPTKGGGTCPVRYSTSLVTGSSGDVLGAVEVISNLSRVKELEQQMQQMKTQAALNQMASLVAHEVRNPLGGIKGYTDLISESFDNGDERIEMIEQIERAISRLDLMVVKFQQFAKPVKPYFQQINIKEYMSDILKILKQEEDISQERIFFETNIHVIPDSWIIRADPILLEQAILAVLDNAVKAVQRDGGSISLEVERSRALKVQQKDYLSIRIRDTGIGMDEIEVKEAFTPFVTSREKGLGLGLALASNFISLHSGDIEVESEKGIGTTVTISIPG